MGRLHRSGATLGFYGDDLDPAELTAAFGVEPTVGVRKGDVWQTARVADKRASTGSWRIKTERLVPADLDRQIAWLLARSSAPLSVWRALSDRYRGMIFCGLWMAAGNEAFVLCPETLLRMGERGLLIDFDVYDRECAD